MPDEDEAQRKAAREREGLEEWLRGNRAEMARRDLTDAAPQSDRGTATATQIEAIDRAAHTPAFHEAQGREDRKPLFSAEEETLLRDQARDYAQLYPTPQAWEQSYPTLDAPSDPLERAQYDDRAELSLREKEANTVTPEQRANVDRALTDIQLSDKISGASDVAGKPQPNDPTPMEKAKDIGQDLQKSGVTMDK